MYESSDFSKTKLISPSIKEINCDISVENEKKLDVRPATPNGDDIENAEENLAV